MSEVPISVVIIVICQYQTAISSPLNASIRDETKKYVHVSATFLAIFTEVSYKT